MTSEELQRLREHGINSIEEVRALFYEVVRLREENAHLRAIVTPVTAHIETGTATPNQTYTWKPGDAWSEYTAATDGDVVRVPILGTLDSATRIPQP